MVNVIMYHSTSIVTEFLLTYHFLLLENLIRQGYPEIISKLEKIIDFIDYEPWVDLKERFIFAKNFRETFLEIFSNKATDLHELVKKYKKPARQLGLGESTAAIVKNIKEEASQILDSQLVNDF